MAEFKDPERELVRFMRVGRLLDWMESGGLALSSPLAWQDAIEAHWFVVIERVLGWVPGVIHKQVFGLCFSCEYYSEALWKRFGNFDDVVRVTMNRAQLTGAVEAWCVANGGIMLSEEVAYRKSVELAVRAKGIIDDLRSHGDTKSLKSRRRLLELWTGKSTAFQFEREHRVLVHLDTGREVSILKVPVNAERCIVKVMFDNRMDPALRRVLRAHLRGAIPKVRTGLTVVNRVPKSLRQLIDVAAVPASGDQLLTRLP